MILNNRNSRLFWLAIALCAILFSCAGNGSGGGCSKAVESAGDESNLQVMSKLILSDSGFMPAVDTIALGRAVNGEVLVGAFEIKNNSSSILVILDIVTGCGCTTVGWTKEPIKIGESREVEFKLDSKGRYGMQVKDIKVITSKSQTAQVVLTCDVTEQ